MATKTQMEALLATACPWCGASAGERCRVRIGLRWRAVPTTLDGESHEARWQAALGLPARVLGGEVARRMGWTEAASEDQPVSSPHRVAVLERPW